MKISCGIYLFRNDNKFLVGHPTGFKPHIWAIPKGRMDVGESDHFEVAKRELTEETCIDLTTLDIVSVKELEIIRYRETNKYLKGFYVKVNDDFLDTDIKCESMVMRNGKPSFPEFDEFKWVTIEESRTMLHEFQHINLDRILTINENLKFIKSFNNYDNKG
jgi:8-oxo-dGTP pyrophosphatase MutT (NUDIX family)